MIFVYLDLILEPRPFAATLHELRADLRTYFDDYGWPCEWVQEDPQAADLEEYPAGSAAFRVHGRALLVFESVAEAHGFVVWG